MRYNQGVFIIGHTFLCFYLNKNLKSTYIYYQILNVRDKVHKNIINCSWYNNISTT